MPGPKYGNFEFPSSFGFTSSAADRSMTTVRSHDRAKPHFARGGKIGAKPGPTIGKRVRRQLMEEIAEAKTRGDTIRPRKLSAIDAVRGTGRRENEQRLGLKEGGRAKLPDASTRRIKAVPLPAPERGPKPKRIVAKAKGGIVYDHEISDGHSIEQRTKPTSVLDQESGGRGPLRPGYSKGGKLRAKLSAVVARGKPIDWGKIAPDTQDVRRAAAARERSTIVRGSTTKHAMGGPVRAKSGGGATAIVRKAMNQHIANPKPRGHGVTSGRMRGGRAC